MEYMQARPINPHVSCVPGFCEMYVQDAFGIKPLYASAKADWSANTYNHRDKNFPKGVAVPIWFSGLGNTGDLALYGHVALLMPDGTVYSASEPGSTTPKHFASIAALESYYGGELNYLGWSEDVEEVLVIKKADEMIGNENYVRILFRQFVNREPTAKELKDYASKDIGYALGKLFPARKDLATVIKERDSLKAGFEEVPGPIYKKKG